MSLLKVFWKWGMARMADIRDPSYPLAHAQQKATKTETRVSSGIKATLTVEQERVFAPFRNVTFGDCGRKLSLFVSDIR